MLRFALVLALSLLLLGCGTGSITAPSFGPCADLGILDPDELDLERAPLWRVPDLDEARRLPMSVKAVRLVGATDQMMAELAAKPNIEEVVFDASPALSFSGIEYLQGLPKLEILDCQGLTLQDTWIDEVAAIPALRELYLRGQTKLTAVGLGKLKDSLTLKELYLEGVPLVDQWMVEIAAIPNLERLDLRGASNLTENTATELAKIATLKRLDLRGCDIENDWLLHLSNPPGAQAIEELILIGNPALTSQSIGYLRSIPSLRELDLSECALNAAWLGEIATLTSLIELRLNDVPPVAVQFWADLVSLVNLETLEVAGSGVGDNHLSHLVKIPKLRKFDLSRSPIGEPGMARLRDMANLVQLFLDGNYGLSNTSLAYLAQIPTLRELRLGIAGAGSYSFSNQGMRRISEMANLQDLTLARANGLGDDDAILFKRLTKLRRLSLIECDHLSGVFVTHLAAAGSCVKRIRVLDCPFVTAGGMRELDRLHNLERLEIPGAADNETLRLLSLLPSLRRLDVSGTNVNDTGLRHLDTRLGLEALTCTGCPISSMAIDEFHAVNPVIVIR